MYKIRPLFKKYQKELVAFANTDYGRDFVSGFGGDELKDKRYPIIKVAPDGIHQLLNFDGKKATCRAVFYPRSPYVRHFAEVLTMMDIAHENNFRVSKKELPLVIPHFMGKTTPLKNKMPTILLNTATFNPDADPEVTSVDGFLEWGGNDTWANVRVAVTGLTANPSAVSYTDIALISCSTTTNQFNDFTRSIYLFDTSSLTINAVVSAATFSFFGKANSQADIGTAAQQALSLVLSTPTTNTNLVVGDWLQLGTVKQATDMAHSAFSTSSYNDIPLTTLTGVVTTGVSKFGLRQAADCDNSQPTWISGKWTTYGGYFSDNGTNKPKLVVTYTTPPLNFLANYRRGSSTV